jgi:hypothetical protein
MTKVTRSKWFLPGFCVALGCAIFAAEWIGGNPREGLYALALMTAFGLVILLGGRSETVRGLRGDARDERFRMMDIHASAFAGFVLIVTLVVLALIELARGNDIDPYGQLLTVGGAAYVAGLAFMRWRG